MFDFSSFACTIKTHLNNLSQTRQLLLRGESMKIHQTQDYTLFKRIQGNRTVSEPHVNRLKEAMEADPETVDYNPIIVNENHEVIDGQHRLQAIESLGLPVSYIKVAGLNLGVVQKINSVAKQWTPMDYAKSYRELGNRSYTIYINYKKQFGYNHDILLKYLSLDNHVTARTFREGKFKVNNEPLSLKYCQYLQDMAEYYPRILLRSQAIGYLYLIRSSSYDHGRMIGKIKRHTGRVQEQTTILDYAREFERIYNFGTRKEPVRLF